MDVIEKYFACVFHLMYLKINKMIEEEYISFETAKLAKGKGFDENVQKAYIEHKGKYNIETNGNISEVLFPENYYFNSDPCYYYDEWNIPYSKPTQSLLARWLREKYDIYVNVIYIHHGFCWIAEIENLINYQTPYHTNGYGTYEKAMEAGLQEALKQIESEETK
jgi:hypothetical protein